MEGRELPSIQIDENSVIIEVDEEFYGKPVILKAAYVFTDKSFTLFKAKDGKLFARLFLSQEAKKAGKTLLELSEEFSRELIEQKMREQVLEETGEIREVIIKRAFQSGGIKIDS